MMDEIPDELCRPTEFLDHDTDVVRAFVAKALDGGGTTAVERAVRLYYAVRDGIRYEIYGSDLTRAGVRASATISKGSGFCVHKSVVYAAALRAAGIPSRLVLADVRNHLTSPRLSELVGGDVFHYHCLTAVQLNGTWVKATPVFNKLLCRLYRMRPLEFDGTADSIYHPHDRQGQRFMEFVRVHGEFDDLPHRRIVSGLRAAHPKLFQGPRGMAVEGSLTADAALL